MNDATNLNTLAGPDFEAIKKKQNGAWASGDYARIGSTLQIVGETLAEAMDLPPGARALDVAAGNGNVTLALARRGARVISTDYVPALLAKGRARADAEGLAIGFQTADAEALPFEAGVFDGVASTFGVMFAPNQEQAARELLRVCRPGGVIGLANWTAEGFIGALFKTLGRYVPPPAGVSSPARWGDATWIREAFHGAARVEIVKKNFVFRYATPGQFLEEFRTYYGPVHKAFAALGEPEAEALAADLLRAIDRYNTARDGSMKVPSEYAEILITRRHPAMSLGELL